MGRSGLIKLVTFLGGLYFFLEYIIPSPIGDFRFNTFSDQISKGFNAVVSMALGLGLINLVMVHGAKIAFLRRGWGYSIALVSGLVAMTAVMIVDWQSTSHTSGRRAELSMLSGFSRKIQQDNSAGVVDLQRTRERNQILIDSVQPVLSRIESELHTQSEESLPPLFAERLKNYNTALTQELVSVRKQLEEISTVQRTEMPIENNERLAVSLAALSQRLIDRLNLMYERSTGRRVYSLLYDGLFVALGSAMFSLLGFYMAAAAYRAFRIRSIESGLMMAAALIVMLGQIPFGIWIWEGFTDIRLWLLSTPSTAAFRAIKLGAAIAGLVMAFRMWLSIESRSFGESER